MWEKGGNRKSQVMNRGRRRDEEEKKKKKPTNKKGGEKRGLAICCKAYTPVAPSGQISTTSIMWIISIPIQVPHSDEEGNAVVVGRKDIRVDGVIPGGRVNEAPGSIPLPVPVPEEEATGRLSDWLPGGLFPEGSLPEGLYEGQILTDPERPKVTLGEEPGPGPRAVVLPPKGSAVLISELPPVGLGEVLVGPGPSGNDGLVSPADSENVLDAPGRFEMFPAALPVELTPGPFEAPLLGPSPPPLLDPFSEASPVDPVPGSPVPGEG